MGNDVRICRLDDHLFVFSRRSRRTGLNDFGFRADVLDLTASGITNPASLNAYANGSANPTVRTVGANNVIDLGANGTITLLNFQVANLDDGDFVGVSIV